MSRTLLVLVAGLSIVSMALAQPTRVDLATRSIVALETQSGKVYCSGFVVRTDMVQTAYHCIASNDGFLKVDGLPAVVLYADELVDGAVLRVKTGKRLPIKVAAANVGDAVVSVGHAVGLRQLTMMAGTVREVSGKYLVTSPMAIPGMSGGPVLNERGEVVGMVHKSYGNGHHEADYAINMKMLEALENLAGLERP